MYQCFHCGQFTVIWQADFSPEEYGYDIPNGVVHECWCSHCGAEITYVINFDEEGAEDEAEGNFNEDNTHTDQED